MIFVNNQRGLSKQKELLDTDIVGVPLEFTVWGEETGTKSKKMFYGSPNKGKLSSD